jgi:hypothetical protein
MATHMMKIKEVEVRKHRRRSGKERKQRRMRRNISPQQAKSKRNGQNAVALVQDCQNGSSFRIPHPFK